jgi:hypothetical protein
MGRDSRLERGLGERHAFRIDQRESYALGAVVLHEARHEGLQKDRLATPRLTGNEQVRRTRVGEVTDERVAIGALSQNETPAVATIDLLELDARTETRPPSA